MLIVPRIAKRTEITQRSVVEVRVSRDGALDTKVSQVKPPPVHRKAKPKTLTEHAFWEMLKEILNGFSAPFEKVDTETFKKALHDFITDLDEQEGK